MSTADLELLSSADLDPKSCLKSSEDVDKLLKIISEKEEQLESDIEQLLDKQCHVSSKMNSIRHSTVTLNAVSKETHRLNAQIEYTSQLAESVSAKVRRLDTARSRVSECQQRVHDLIDLQLCSAGVMAAIDEENYEVGAGHISRFLAMDLQLLRRTADDVNSSVSSVSEAVQTLESATTELGELVVKRFDESVKRDDLASVERFFKIFPLLGRYREGIQKFSSYICTKLKSKAEKELRNALDIAKAEKRLPLAYADTLTSLLENFARVVEVNQPIVEACYGSGYLLDMLKILQIQCDGDVKNLLLEFNKSRKIKPTIQKVNECFRATNTSSGMFSGSGGGSSTSLSHHRKPSSGGSRGNSLDKINPKEIDAVITEITVMHSRAELYFRFMKRRVGLDIEATNDDESKPMKLEELNKTLLQSDLSRQMQELLGNYLLLEKYFMEESVLKAIALDAYESGQQCSSMVDDIFFILRKSVRRAISSQSVNGTCAVINNATSCLESDFANALRCSLKSGYPSGYIDLAQAYSALQTTFQQGKLQTNDNEKARINFLIQLNNADMATEFIDTLWQTTEQEITGAFVGISSVEKQLIDSCLVELKSVRDVLKACVDLGMQQLRSSAIKPRLHPWIDHFSTYKHHLTDEELINVEAGETFAQYLIVQIDGLLANFKQLLTARNYDALVSLLAIELATRLEKVIRKCTFNRLGGLILDQDVRALSTYLASVTSWSVRDKMTRLTQISTLLNMEKVNELEEYWSPDSSSGGGSLTHTWRLTPNEIRLILTLRSDFRIEDIKRLKI